MHAEVSPASRHAAVDELFRDYNRPDAPGAGVMIIQDGRVLLTKCWGLANVEEKAACTADTNFRLASVTKQFTAMAVMILADSKELSLDDRIVDYFPEFPDYGKRITIRHLLHHTSGLKDYERLIPKGTALPVVDINVLRLLQKEGRTFFAPGTRFRYSNTGYAFLALIVEKVSGQTFASFLRRNIFKPLGMDGTLAYEAGISEVPNRAFGYVQAGNRFKRADQSLTSSVLGDGGVYSSLNDLCRWDWALQTTKLVSRGMLAQAFAPGKATRHSKGVEYGFGWFLSSDRGWRKVWHSGNTIGFTTRIERLPEKKFAIIILANRNEAPLGGIARRLAGLFLDGAE
jgi:CubicO group peptidase (beta-lactamase class C family)